MQLFCLFESFGFLLLVFTLASTEISNIQLKKKYEVIEGKVYEVIKGENCFRKCEYPNVLKICEFYFDASWWHTLNEDCQNCPINIKDCFNPNCTSADGSKSLIQVINKELPGPSIQVCENDVIKVKVTNNLQHGSGLTIHWHGLHQVGSQFNDGVPYITQCFIDYKASFQYQFKAYPAGSHIWHSHASLQIGDGIHGALIVRKPLQLDKNNYLYDEDMADHYILMHTFREIPDELAFQTLITVTEYIGPVSILINGRAHRINYDGQYTPLTKYKVKQGKRYRFRLMNIGSIDCRLIISFDYHKMTIIATDTGEVYPEIVDSLNLDPGQRVDVVIEANNNIGNYYITVKGEAACINFESKAILSYDGAENTLPFETPQLSTKPILFNFLNQEERKEYTTIIFSNIVSLDYDPFLREDPNIVLYFKLKNTEAPGIEAGNPTKALINSISFMEPMIPLWLMNQSSMEEQSCTMESLKEKNVNCTEKLCECTHLYQIPLESNVEIVLLAYAPLAIAGNHPMHLHGHSFKVVSMGTFDEEMTITNFKKMDIKGKFHRNLINPPETDTIAFPSSGYTIIRFVANNPGWWLFHCHLDFHVQWGMQVVFVVGNDQDLPVPPNGFPKCGTWTGNHE